MHDDDEEDYEREEAVDELTNELSDLIDELGALRHAQVEDEMEVLYNTIHRGDSEKVSKLRKNLEQATTDLRNAQLEDIQGQIKTKLGELNELLDEEEEEEENE